MKTATVTPLGPGRGAAVRGLRIAMVAPPYFALPPLGYGGVEVIVAGLVDELVERGHHVTLLGAGRNGTRAQSFLVTYPEPPAAQLGEALPEAVHAARVAELLADCDVDLVHDHTLVGPVLARGRQVPTVVTVHGPATGDMGDFSRALGDTVRLISISDSQRATAPDLPWLATVHNAISVSTFPFQAEKDDVALFLGRFHPEKAPHLAIDAARGAGLPIVLAGKCSEPVEREYFAREIEPRLGPDVEIFGVADPDQKRRLLARACCLLFPIRWEEPFGLVMIEAMACGTPVVALRRGAVPEIVVDGVTGVIVDEPEELPDAIRLARQLDPHACRAHVERDFSTAAMGTGYELAYQQLLEEKRARSPLASASR
jgi:glycosyltransferase involved in cell wall biosynthesis